MFLEITVIRYTQSKKKVMAIFGNITKGLNRIAKIGNGHMHAGGES